MIVHQPTLLIVATLAIGFSGAMLALIPGPRSGTDSLRVWGLAMLVGALGLVLLESDPYPAWRTGDVGVALLLGATSVSWMAARMFGGRRPRPYLSAAGPVLWLLLIPLHEAGAFWVGAACVVGATYTSLTAFDLSRSGEDLPSRRPAVILLIGHAGVYLLRAALAVAGVNSVRWPAALPDGLVMETLLHTLGMAFLLLAMVKERVERRSGEHLRVIALQDSLTGVANRRRFDEQALVEVRRARRHRTSLALLMIDIDYFKRYNDTHGHLLGDVCLRAVAQAIAQALRRPGDLVARYGGEEFAVLLPHTDLAGALGHAERIRASVGAMEGGPAGVTISVGVAAFVPGSGATEVETLIRAADDALYTAKAAGRNVVRAARAPDAGVRRGADLQVR